MNRRVIIGEIAGMAWLIADAAWAIGDRCKIDNTKFMTFMFLMAIGFGVWFVWLQCGTTPAPPDRAEMDGGGV